MGAGFNRAGKSSFLSVPLQDRKCRDVLGCEGMRAPPVAAGATLPRICSVEGVPWAGSWVLNVNASNLLGKEFVSNCAGEVCYYGPDRSVTATLTYRW
ncbi:hypothetical protein GCM10007923_22890 [Shinella yambaruensis]|uniref:TonB-dependent receptor n=1 Tax=Shinella yambaruensis TaxID=415996 RepID=A0ABQ5ZGC5_9HYPH|nr:hypothetical protein GCM10007923_22890 [Shinella yambaruensis]